MVDLLGNALNPARVALSPVNCVLLLVQIKRLHPYVSLGCVFVLRMVWVGSQLTRCLHRMTL